MENKEAKEASSGAWTLVGGAKATTGPNSSSDNAELLRSKTEFMDKKQAL